MDFDFLSLLLFVLYLVTAAFRIWVTKRNLARGVLSNLKSEFWSSNCSNVSLFWSLLFHIPKAKMTWPPHLHLCEIAFNRHPFFTCDLEFLIVSFSLLHLIFFSCDDFTALMILLRQKIYRNTTPGDCCRQYVFVFLLSFFHCYF